MEIEKQIKTLKILLIIFGVIILGLGAFVVYRELSAEESKTEYVDKNDEENENKNNDTNQTNNNNNKSSNNQQLLDPYAKYKDNDFFRNTNIVLSSYFYYNNDKTIPSVLTARISGNDILIELDDNKWTIPNVKAKYLYDSTCISEDANILYFITKDNYLYHVEELIGHNILDTDGHIDITAKFTKIYYK